MQIFKDLDSTFQNYLATSLPVVHNQSSSSLRYRTKTHYIGVPVKTLKPMSSPETKDPCEFEQNLAWKNACRKTIKQNQKKSKSFKKKPAISTWVRAAQKWWLRIMLPPESLKLGGSHGLSRLVWV